MAGHFHCRKATIVDADAIAAVFSSSYRLLTFLPPVRTDEERRGFIENVILKTCKVIVAEDETSTLVGPGWSATINALGYIELTREAA